MKQSVLLGAAGFVGAAVMLGQFASGDATDASRRGRTAPTTPTATASEASPETSSPSGGSVGPDVIVWSLSGISNWTDGTYRAYSVGTTSCNIGNQPLAWQSNTNQHPVIGQNLFRIAPGQNGHARMEQLGQGWLKHGFCALDLGACGSCQATGCSSLGVGCSDPYTAARNGSQGPAGPKYQVNASTGYFPYPPANPPYSGTTARRLRALVGEVDLDLNPGAKWYIEGQYIHPQDSPEDNLEQSANNVSYRRVIMDGAGVGTLTGTTVQQTPALNEWAAQDPGVLLVNVDIPSEGRFVVASRAFDNGDGTWDYEYAVFNMNVDRSAGSVSIPVPDGVSVSSLGFRDVPYHSGETWDGTDWASNVGSGAVSWATDDYASNQNANAIRWATMYNFRFTANSGPVDGEMTIGLFKPGAVSSVAAAVRVPDAVVVDCPADFDGNLMVDFNDLLQLLAAWGPCAGCVEDLDASNDVGFNDLLILLAAWGDC